MKASNIIKHMDRNEKALLTVSDKIEMEIINLTMHRRALAKINKTNSKMKKSIMFKKCNIVFSKLCKLQDIKTLETKLNNNYRTNIYNSI